jgi:hypothetical protein
LSRYEVGTSTFPDATFTAASTCQRFSPVCHTFFGRGLEQLIFRRRDGEVGILLLLLLELGLQVLPLRILELCDRRRVHVLAVEGRLLQLDADYARGAAADVDLAVGDTGDRLRGGRGRRGRGVATRAGRRRR